MDVAEGYNATLVARVDVSESVARFIVRPDAGPVAFEPGPDTVAYLCGNPEMIAASERLLLGRGFAPAAIRTEHYWPAARPTV